MQARQVRDCSIGFMHGVLFWKLLEHLGVECVCRLPEVKSQRQRRHRVHRARAVNTQTLQRTTPIAKPASPGGIRRLLIVAAPRATAVNFLPRSRHRARLVQAASTQTAQLASVMSVHQAGSPRAMAGKSARIATRAITSRRRESRCAKGASTGMDQATHRAKAPPTARSARRGTTVTVTTSVVVASMTQPAPLVRRPKLCW
mmetsp:Transcript_23981/g.64874  ORF Transcript_23981/g.64874 Transcript_23981/m.64874 type:complete len:202 (+) Transcript_23981:1999-2604(+)